jgi:hypothetical protein
VGLSEATSFRAEWRIPLPGGAKGGFRRESALTTPVLKCAEMVLYWYYNILTKAEVLIPACPKNKKASGIYPEAFL